ncbi:MAG: DUF1643 domain-containing protein [Thermosynechococcaceae cyanobacterium]
MDGGAIFDATGQYRYTLWREWDARRSRLCIVMLNPSEADETHNDPTIRRCIAFGQRLGYGSVEIVNLFAYRTPYPQALKQALDPIGSENDQHLLQASHRSRELVLAWGNWGSLWERDRQVRQLLAGTTCYCFGLNRTGQPRHPLYLPRATQLMPYPMSYQWENGKCH